MVTSLAFFRLAEIDKDPDIGRLHALHQSLLAPDSNIHRFGTGGYDAESHRDVLEFDRDLQRHLGLSARGHKEPQKHRQKYRRYLQPGVFQQEFSHFFLFGAVNMSVRTSLIVPMSSFVSSLPFIAIEMNPVSSETMIATASVSSVRPIPALCRVPSALLSSELSVIGRKQPAAAILLPLIMTA